MGNLLNRPSQRHVHFSIRKFPMTSVCDNSLYLSISFSVYVTQTQSLFGACCLRTLLHLRHYLHRVHSDLNNMLFEQCQGIICGSSSVKAQYVEQCQGSALPQHLPVCGVEAVLKCLYSPSGHTRTSFQTGLVTLISGLYAGISMTVMWSEAPRWWRGKALSAPLWKVETWSRVLLPLLFYVL